MKDTRGGSTQKSLIFDFDIFLFRLYKIFEPFWYNIFRCTYKVKNYGKNYSSWTTDATETFSPDADAKNSFSIDADVNKNAYGGYRCHRILDAGHQNN